MKSNLPLFQYRYETGMLDLSKRPYIMGILNVTPDSFSDGGKYIDRNSAVKHALRMLDDGADIIDIGGESTRPGSDQIPVDEELSRVQPVIEELVKQRPEAVLSIDTCKADVAREALKNGAVIVNDISALRYDEKMTDVVREYEAVVVLMHMKGMPKTMQNNPQYDDVIGEIKTFLQERIDYARRMGIEKIIIDPGIGFGKRLEDNLEILKSLRQFTELGCPVLIGASRKSFIGKISGIPAGQRCEESLAAAVISIVNGAAIVRVHDVAATARAVRITHAVMCGAGYGADNSGVT